MKKSNKGLLWLGAGLILLGAYSVGEYVRKEWIRLVWKH